LIGKDEQDWMSPGSAEPSGSLEGRSMEMDGWTGGRATLCVPGTEPLFAQRTSEILSFQNCLLFVSN